MPVVLKDSKQLPENVEPDGPPFIVTNTAYTKHDVPEDLSREALEERSDADYLVLGSLSEYYNQLGGCMEFSQAVQAYKLKK